MMKMTGRFALVNARFVALLVLFVTATAGAHAQGTIHHYIFAVDKDGPSILYIYDVDNGFALVKQTTIATTYTGADMRGLVASAATGMLYLSHGCYYAPSSCSSGGGYLAKYDLGTDTLLWDVHYSSGIDSFSIAPDGKTIYMPAGEDSGSAMWYVLDAGTGAVLTSINSGQTGAHNTIVSNSGAHVYLGSDAGATEFVMANTATNTVAQNIGPTQSGIRPFTINSAETLAFLTETDMLGFQVGDIATGAILYTVNVGGSYAAACTAHPGKPCSHGISLSPDNKEIYVTDIYNNYVHVYDVSGLPGSAPVNVADIPLAHNYATTGWLYHSRDGLYLYVGGSGDVISTSTRQIVSYLPALSQTEKFAEIDYQNGDYQTGTIYFAPLSRSGVGYAAQTSNVGLSSLSLSFGNQTVGTSSSAQTTTLTNNGTSALSIGSIAVTGANSGDFQESNNCGASLAATAACTISVSFAPTATGNLLASVTITDSDASSPQTVSLAGTGVATPTPSAHVSPGSLSFPSQTVGNTSGAQAVTLSNSGNAPLTISGIATSGDFAQTNNCGASVAAGTNCLINVTFKPAAAGARSGTLTITDNDASGSQSVSLSGTGVAPGSADFSISAGPTSVTVMAGQTATSTISVSASNGFNQAVSLSCTGAPQAASCSISPSTVTPSGSAAVTATLTLTTTAQGAAPIGWRWRPLPFDGWRPAMTAAAWFLMMVVLSLLAARLKRKRLAVGFAMGALLLIGGCAASTNGKLSTTPGGGSSGSPGTPSGSYTLTVTGTSGSGSSALTHSATVTLIVN